MAEIYKFDVEKHAHYINGERCPGVSTIAGMIDDGKSGALQGWAAKLTAAYIADNISFIDGKVFVGNLELNPDTAGKIMYRAKQEYRNKRDEAADLGTRIHKLCELFWGDEKYEIASDEEPGYSAFEEWVQDNGVKAIAVEKNVYSVKNRYAGIVDLVAELNGSLYIIDLKTSSRISPGFFIQVGGYALAYEEMTGDRINNAGILRLDKETGLPEWCDLTGDLNNAKSDFLACVDIYEDIKRFKKTIKGGQK